MRLDSLRIEEFKNLRNFHIDFDEESPYTVLVGENGAGKSNLIEALTEIFRALDLDIVAPFSYDLVYTCRGHSIRVKASVGKIPQFWIRELSDSQYHEIGRRQFMRDDEAGAPLYRPAFVFGYYSGPSDRLSSLYERHRERYYEWIIRDQASRKPSVSDPNVLRRLFYAENLHGQFALLAFFMDSSPQASADREFLREHLQIDGLDSVLFALKRPPWRRRGGDPRFWNAVGEVQEFLSHLYDVALMPMRMDRRIQVDLTKNPAVECLYLFLPVPEALEEVYGIYGDQYRFFTALESTHLSKLLGEVRTRVRLTPAAGGGQVTYRDLSEGEQQLLLVLGLLKFTARSEALFLLDEPDTHLNPAWSTRYLDFLDRFILGRESCHIVMTTHDPLVFSRLLRSQVRILRRVDDESGRTVAEEPLDDPRGMGVEAILGSDLFRLSTAGLDLITARQLERQRELALKIELTENEEEELAGLTEKVAELQFWRSDPDPIYQLFLQRFMPLWLSRSSDEELNDVQLTKEQLLERDRVADEISAQIAADLEGDVPSN